MVIFRAIFNPKKNTQKKPNSIGYYTQETNIFFLNSEKI